MNHILLVEDSESDAFIIKERIQQELGLLCDWVKSRADGIKKLRERMKLLPYYCVVWDCVLPNGDYSDVACVRALSEPDTSVIAISAIEKHESITPKQDLNKILFAVKQCLVKHGEKVC